MRRCSRRSASAAALLGVFGALGLMLAAIGVWSVVSYAASRRTREVGVRSALGASPRAVVRLFVGESLRRVLFGVGAGSWSRRCLARFLRGLLYGSEPGRSDDLRRDRGDVDRRAEPWRRSCLPAALRRRSDRAPCAKTDRGDRRCREFTRQLALAARESAAAPRLRHRGRAHAGPRHRRGGGGVLGGRRRAVAPAAVRPNPTGWCE